MKKLSEMKFSKDALLSSIDSAAMGAYVSVGKGTSYYGPSNPSSITTYVDGINMGSDGLSGSLYGDSWATRFEEGGSTGDGTLKVMKQR